MDAKDDLAVVTGVVTARVIRERLDPGELQRASSGHEVRELGRAWSGCHLLCAQRLLEDGPAAVVRARSECPIRDTADMSNELAPLIDRLRQFRDERGWRAEHTPKELAISVAIEAGELLACFQWRTGAEIDARDERGLQAIRDEMADVMIYLTQLADELGMDLVDAAFDKIGVNERRFPPASDEGVE